MKKIIMFSLIILSVYACSKTGVNTPSAVSLLPTATVTPTGKDWEQSNTANAFSTRLNAASVELGGAVFVIAGRGVSGPVSDVWFSKTGDAWFTGTAFAPFPPRENHAAISYDNRIWVIGGSNAANLGDVWCSESGVTWTVKTALAQFGARSSFAAFSFAGRMWVAAGLGNKGPQNDVWRSKDGSSWERAKENNASGFTARSAPAYCSYKGKMWIIGGNQGGPLNDVWFSDNGSDWSAATLNAEFSQRSGAKAVVYRDRLWLIAGEGKDGKQLSDVWWTGDGIIWRQATPDAAFGPRAGFITAVFRDSQLVDNRLFVAGGVSGREIRNDGWYCR